MLSSDFEKLHFYIFFYLLKNVVLNYKEKSSHFGNTSECRKKSVHVLLLIIPSFQLLMTFQLFPSVFSEALYALLFFINKSSIVFKACKHYFF